MCIRYQTSHSSFLISHLILAKEKGWGNDILPYLHTFGVEYTPKYTIKWKAESIFLKKEPKWNERIMQGVKMSLGSGFLQTSVSNIRHSLRNHSHEN